MSDFYEFEHECDSMPDGVDFVKIRGSRSSQFTVERRDSNVGIQSTVFYGFRFCPYCGEDMEGGRK